MNDLNYSKNPAVRARARCFHVLFLLPALIACLGLMLAGQAPAQIFTTLYNFTAGSDSSGYVFNSDGANPYAGVIVSGNTLYGTTWSGGSGASGTVFAINVDGTGFRNLHTFTARVAGANSDGALPYAGLIVSGNTLYGTAGWGGSGGGTVFAVNTDGSGFTNLHSFTNGDGAIPGAGLILSSNTLYGTASEGIPYGTIFRINTDGTAFTVLHGFTPPFSDGDAPGGLVLSGNTLYGTASDDGSGGSRGTVFAINTDGSGFKVLHSFAALFPGYTNSLGSVIYTNSGGARPTQDLLLSGNILYGTALFGGSGGNGTLFAIHTDGTGFTNLYTFTAADGFTSDGFSINSDGANPSAPLILSGNTLYGTAGSGGSGGAGTVFAINTDGSGFTNLYSFTAWSGAFINTDGGYPVGVILSGNTLYGTAEGGGSGGTGTIFSLSLPAGPPQLSITPAGATVILTWPTNSTDFTLQSTTNLGASAVWVTNSAPPLIVNGQNTVTNPISGTQQFYRLSR
jgi:uncharacterized repeat protein (TIGR03803 family)